MERMEVMEVMMILLLLWFWRRISKDGPPGWGEGQVQY